MRPTRWKHACIAIKKNSHKKEKGQILFLTDRALNDADKEKTGLSQKNHKYINIYKYISWSLPIIS